MWARPSRKATLFAVVFCLETVTSRGEYIPTPGLITLQVHHWWLLTQLPVGSTSTLRQSRWDYFYLHFYTHTHPPLQTPANSNWIVHSIHISQLGHNSENKPVFLRDIWPKRDELQAVEKKFVIPRLFQEVYSKITTGNERWNKLEVPLGQNYEWEEASTYIKRPPFFEGRKPMSLRFLWTIYYCNRHNP